ncbi:MAG: family 43 glycosylhydrolase [Bacteroidetes bacterium]|nr:family 43 glycosylhydrolase [Bacteroidota bacterium]
MKSLQLAISRATAFVAFTITIAVSASAQNPFILDQFTADPSARVFNNRVYVYPSHDIPCTESRGRIGWFCMEDYHVFSSADLIHWTDHGVIVSQDKVPWVNPNGYSMWAPDCVFKNGKYYFYFPTRPKDTTNIKGFTIGVAIADHPEGPFTPLPTPIEKVNGIDPNVFIDKDGSAYLYWAQGNLYVAKLKDNMTELATEPTIVQDLPTKGLKEGPYLFERNGIYYFTYPHVQNKTERLEYATASTPLGPFKFAGVIMDESPTGCWTNHQSMIEFNHQWYLFYHHNDLSPTFDKNRSIRVDSLFFNPDGTIQKVTPTLRGVGLTDADTHIQLDRYTKISDAGAAISFLDTLDKSKGWQLKLTTPQAWVQYNSVDFKTKQWKTVSAMALSPTGATLEIHLNDVNGPLVSQINIPKSTTWTLYSSKLSLSPKNTNHLVITIKNAGEASIDYITFN